MSGIIPPGKPGSGKPRRLPYSVANFEQILEEDYYLVDKTAFIRELENYRVPVFLRPRRFGKTLWCSTLECYYDIRRKEKFEELFGHLDIGRKPTDERNSYMVLRLNFSTVQVSMDMAKLERNFASDCRISLESFLRLHSEYFEDLVQLDPALPAADHMKSILTAVAEKALPPIYLIIDEYDNFVNQLITSRREDLYEELTTGDSFFRTFFKAVKAGCESRAIGRVFITGVLPITMDDMTSGFNIAEVVSLKAPLHNMMGFTQAEVDDYLENVLADYTLDRAMFPAIQRIMKDYYNGYRFLLDAPDTIYNSTILTYFLKHLSLDRGYPVDMIDPNVKTDVSWIERLGFGEGTPLALMQELLHSDGLAFDARNLRDKFNMRRFFEVDHYPASLFWLGMLTVQSKDRLGFPNQTLMSIFADYYSILARVEVSKGYTGYFARFRESLDLEGLFAGYYERYLGQIPAQAFDKVNENFVRTTFFELCTRYLFDDFSFAIEAQHTGGRSDWEMLGRPESPYRKKQWLLEFKYLGISSGTKPGGITEPPADAVAQLLRYKADILSTFPQYEIRCAVCVVVANIGFSWFNVA
ncbi:MAG: AAA family ATPase [Spirochaetota bacterium]